MPVGFWHDVSLALTWASRRVPKQTLVASLTESLMAWQVAASTVLGHKHATIFPLKQGGGISGGGPPGPPEGGGGLLAWGEAQAAPTRSTTVNMKTFITELIH